jgi:hypothetical protein
MIKAQKHDSILLGVRLALRRGNIFEAEHHLI